MPIPQSAWPWLSCLDVLGDAFRIAPSIPCHSPLDTERLMARRLSDRGLSSQGPVIQPWMPDSSSPPSARLIQVASSFIHSHGSTVPVMEQCVQSETLPGPQYLGRSPSLSVSLMSKWRLSNCVARSSCWKYVWDLVVKLYFILFNF